MVFTQEAAVPVLHSRKRSPFKGNHMEEILTGIGAFGILVLFEYQKCRNVRQNKKGRNPWFLLGMLLLIGAFVMEAVKDEASQGIRLAAGIGILAAGLSFYAAVLGIAVGKQGYTEDLMGTTVSRKGMYGHVRHPGVWSFLVCALGYGMIFPEGMGLALGFAFLNLIYTWLQDRFFFPVYLDEYEEYKKEVPYLFPRLK